MSTDDKNQPANALRRRAEQRIKDAGAPHASTIIPAFRLQHEMSVYQVELEMQNEELREARERAEAALAHYQQEAEAARTLHAQDEAARVAAEADNLAKSQFLATMSHELRTPLNGVLGTAQLLMLPGLTEEKRRTHVDTILKSGKILLALLNDILDLSKVEADRIEFLHEEFDPKVLGEEIVALFAEVARTKGLKITFVWHGPHDQRYWSDPFRLRQMLSNLVSNAIKFTTHGFIRVEACQIEGTTGDTLLEFSVTDSGIGIAADKQSLLFKRFSQVETSTTRSYGGAGLGLSIVRGLAEKMGGEAGLESAGGKGARFWFRIRAEIAAKRATNPLEDMPGNANSKAALSQTQASARPVLLVEDNRMNQMVFMDFLNAMGIEAQCLENGQDAVDAIRGGKRYSLVLMDLQMPVMGGIEATERIRQWEKETQQPGVPMIALTASVYAADRQRCVAAGIDDFLEKPIDLNDLTRVLNQWRGGTRLTA